jgi:hypothetical protein
MTSHLEIRIMLSPLFSIFFVPTAWGFLFPTRSNHCSGNSPTADLSCSYTLAFIFEKWGWLEKVCENSKALSRVENVAVKVVVGISAVSYGFTLFVKAGEADFASDCNPQAAVVSFPRSARRLRRCSYCTVQSLAKSASPQNALMRNSAFAYGQESLKALC